MKFIVTLSRIFIQFFVNIMLNQYCLAHIFTFYNGLNLNNIIESISTVYKSFILSPLVFPYYNSVGVKTLCFVIYRKVILLKSFFSKSSLCKYEFMNVKDVFLKQSVKVLATIEWGKSIKS